MWSLFWVEPEPTHRDAGVGHCGWRNGWRRFGRRGWLAAWVAAPPRVGPAHNCSWGSPSDGRGRLREGLIPEPVDIILEGRSPGVYVALGDLA